MPSSLLARQHRGAQRVIRWRRRGERPSATSLPVAILLSALFAVVFFLLTLFAATGEVSGFRRLARVPRARNVLDLTTAPIVSVRGGQILANDHPVASARDIAERGHVAPRIDEMFNALKTLRDDWQKINPGSRDFPGMVNLEIEGDVPAVVVVSVYRTCALAGYPNVNLVVERMR